MSETTPDEIPPKPEKCPVCGLVTDDLEWGPDPYAHDIYGDDTPSWQCGACLYQSGMDI